MKRSLLKGLCVQFTNVSHLTNISVCLITQNLLNQGLYCRDISLNVKYIVELKNVHDKYQFHHMAGKVYPEDGDGLYKAYLVPQDVTRICC